MPSHLSRSHPPGNLGGNGTRPERLCLGEDIGIYGGAFKVTDGFIDRFGAERVIDTPIAESAIVGAAFGASLTGLRPVAEFQFMDFIGCAFNQIVNMVGSAHYRWERPLRWCCAAQAAAMCMAAHFIRKILRCGLCTRPD